MPGVGYMVNSGAGNRAYCQVEGIGFKMEGLRSNAGSTERVVERHPEEECAVLSLSG